MTTLEQLSKEIQRVETRSARARPDWAATASAQWRSPKEEFRKGGENQAERDHGPESYLLSTRERCESDARGLFFGAVCFLMAAGVCGLIAAQPKAGGLFFLVAGLFVGSLVCLGAGFGARSRVYEVRISDTGPISFVSIKKERKAQPAEIYRVVRYEHYQDHHLGHFRVGCPQEDISVPGPVGQLERVFTRIKALAPQASIEVETFGEPDPD